MWTTIALAQESPEDLLRRHVLVQDGFSVESMGVTGFEAGADGESSPSPRRGTPKRQAILIGSVALSMAAYGYFILDFNNSRAAAGDAERAYEEDVRQNAQTYVDQGIALDEIPTFLRWQEAYDDAKRSREWAARAGFLAVVIGFFAILDAATSNDLPPPSASGVVVRPTVGVGADGNDLVVGARLKF